MASILALPSVRPVQAPLARPFVVKFCLQGTRAVVAFSDRTQRDERAAQLLAKGVAVTLQTVRS